MGNHFTVVVTLVAVVGMTLGAAPGAVFATDHTDPPPPDQTFTATEGIEVWERAFLPLRADTSNAAVTVDNADWRVNGPDGNEKSLNRDPVGVYEPDAAVTVEFDLGDADGDSTAFRDTPVQLIAAHVQETGEGEVPGNVSEALDLLTKDDANVNASFTEVATDTLDSSSGDATFTYTPNAPGVHVFFLAVNESGRDGFVIDGSGNITTVDGNVSVIGVEAIGVRKTAPSVSAPSGVVRGNSADFDVDAGVAGSNVEHLLVVYHESTFVDSSFLLDIDESPNADFDIENNSTLHSTIDEVNGIAHLSEPVGAFGVNVNDGTVSGTATLPSIIDFVAEAAGTEKPQYQDLDSSSDVVLDGSATGANGSASRTLTIETFDNWSTGTYRWVYVAVGSSSQESTADTGTFSVNDPPTSPPPGGGGGGGGGAPPGGGGGGGAPPPSGPQFELNVSALVENVSVGIRNAPGRHHIPVSVPVTSPAAETGSSFTHVNFTLVPEGDYDMTIAPDRAPPGRTPPLADQRRATAVSYVQITHTFAEADAEDVTIRFTVNKSALEARDQRPENVGLYRFSDGEWSRFDAELVTETAEAYVFEATPPGLSVFAIGTGDPALSVAAASLSATEIEAGSSVEITGTVENAGEGTGTYTAVLRVDGEVVDQQAVDVAPDGSAEVRFERTFESPGDYQLAVDDAAAGTLRVAQPSTPGQPSTPDLPTTPVVPGSPTPGGGGLLDAILTVALATALAAVVVASLLYLYARRYG